jgi:hypothetical protein
MICKEELAMKLIKSLRLFLHFTLLLSVFFLTACPFDSDNNNDPGGISISAPAENDVVSGIIEVRGSCSVIDDLIVVIDNDSYTQQAVDCSQGNWNAEFDTSYFQDKTHVLVAYKNSIHDEIQITTANGNLDGFTVTVPVSLATGVYDEINELTPLYVYAKKPATGLITGELYILGMFPGDFVIPNLLNGVYEIGAFLDRNNNRVMDEGFDFAGMATTSLEVSNGDERSGNVVLELYIIDDGDDLEDGIFNPADVTGSIEIRTPLDDETVSGVLTASGRALGDIQNVQVTIDNNLLTAQIVPLGVARVWSADFDTTRLQDGRHNLTARANSEIEDRVYFNTDNGNVQGYRVTISVELAPGLGGEIDAFNPLIIYVESPVSGARQFNRFETGFFGADSAFTIDNVPNNTYKVGAFYDRNNNGVADEGDYTGATEQLLNVWYADTNAQVTLHGDEINILTPLWGAEIRSNFIDMTGSYLGGAEEIIVSMHLTPVTYVTAEDTAHFNAGAWDAVLDITAVTQEGSRWLNARAKYGARYKWDSIQVIINRNFPRGVAIESPIDNTTIQTSTFITSGSYDGEPESVTVYLDRGDTAQVIVGAALGNSAWTASFTDLTGVETGLILHTLTAVADYGGGITEEDEIGLYIDPIANRFIAITIPSEGDTVTTDNLVVQGTYGGNPDSITVTFETNGIGDVLTEIINTPVADSWSVEFADISSVLNGQRSITAVADYGGGDTEVASVTVTVDRPVSAVPLTITTDIPWLNEGCGAYFIINDSNELSLDGFYCAPPPPSADVALVMALIDSDTHADFDAGPGWTLHSRTDANPVDESVLASYILQRSGGGDYFKLSIDFEIVSGSGLQYEINDGLAGWNCGANPANCP